MKELFVVAPLEDNTNAADLYTALKNTSVCQLQMNYMSTLTTDGAAELLTAIIKKGRRDTRKS
jgi:hypothetical protein